MSAARSFLAGLRRPGWKPMLVGAAFAIVVLLTLELFLCSSLIRFLPEDRLLASKVDQFTHARLTIAKLGSLQCGGRCIFLIGGSTLREAIDTEVLLSQAIRARTGEDNRIIDLSFFKQTTGEAMAIVERIPRNSGLVVLSINAHRFTTDPKRFLPADNYLLTSAYAFSSEPKAFLKEEKVPAQASPVLPEAARWLAYYFHSRRAELGRLWRPAQTKFQRRFYDENTRLPLEKTLEMARLAEQAYVPAFAANAPFHSRALARIVRIAKERGLDIAFFDQPFHPMVGAKLDALAESARKRAAKVAKEADIPFWDSAKGMPLSAVDFQDIQHVVGDGRSRMQEELAEKIAQWQIHRRERVVYGHTF